MEKQYKRLGRKAFWIFVFQNSLPTILVFIIFIATMAFETLEQAMLSSSIMEFLPLVILLFFALFILLLVADLLFSYITYISYEFLLDDNALRIRKGLISKNETSIPYRQIQDVDMEESITDRIFGVARLAVLTAGHEDKEPDSKEDFSEGAFPAIDKDEALSIREALLKNANIEKVSNVTSS